MDNQDDDNGAEAKPSSLRFLTKKEVMRKVPFTAPTLWKRVREGTFPKPRALGSRSVWFEHEVDAAMMALPVRRYKP
jgi:prophage regulatory protein